MTQVLEKAFSEAAKLPRTEQDAFGRWLLAEIESDRKWDDLFAKSQNELLQLAMEALGEAEEGRLV
jgi:hypothetical protein